MKQSTIDLPGLRHLLRSRRGDTQHCGAPGCSRATRENKPYCSDHVDQHPYVQGLLGKLEGREAEEARVRRQGPRAVDTESLTSNEILQHLSFHGNRTVERLARELNLEIKTLHGYVRALKQEGLVTLSRNKRGSTVVEPTSQPAWLQTTQATRN